MQEFRAEMESIVEEKVRAEMESIVEEKVRAEMKSIVEEKVRAEMESIVEEKVRAEMESVEEKLQSRLGFMMKSKFGSRMRGAKENDENSMYETIGTIDEEGGERCDGGQGDNDDGNGSSGQGGTVAILTDEGIKKELFVNSTHQFLFKDKIELPDGREPYKVDSSKRFTAVWVIFLQFYTYVMLVVAVDQERTTNGYGSSTVDLMIESKYCHDPNALFRPWNYYDNLTDGEVSNDNFLDLLKCSKLNYNTETQEVKKAFIIIQAYLLVSIFLLSDFFEVFVLVRCSDWRAKATSVLVFLKGLSAYFVAYYGVYRNGNAFSTLDTFLFIVGIVFVQDLDDKVGYMYDVCRRLDFPCNNYWKSKKCWSCDLEVQFWVLFIPLTNMIFVIFQIIQNQFEDFQ